jgi:hypothetical protein
MHVHATASAFFFVFLSIVMTASARGRAVADTCVESPDRETPRGEHWYYHLDREKNRKCWHLGPAVSTAAYEAAPVRMERPRTAGPTLNSVFTPLLRGIRNFLRQPMPHEAAAGEPRIVQNDATKPLTIEDIAQPPEFPEERAEARPAQAPSLTASQRKALYAVFIKWEALQRDPGGGAPAR